MMTIINLCNHKNLKSKPRGKVNNFSTFLRGIIFGLESLVTLQRS